MFRKRKRLVDLFCGAGGTSLGYYQAGFEIVGVDINPQPHYPFTFIQADAMTFDLDGYDAAHASPPCQAYTKGASSWGSSDNHPKLINPLRSMLFDSGIPYVIENVPQCYDLQTPIMLCGQMFRLGVFRHRHFETSFDVPQPGHCVHDGYIGDGHYFTVAGNSGGSSSRDGWVGGSLQDWRIAMGIKWMNVAEIREAIPPAYTSWLGKWLYAAS